MITGLSRDSGGPSRSCQGLVAAECGAGIDACVWPVEGGTPWVSGVRAVDCPVHDLKLMRQTLRQFSLVHIHGIWNLALHKVASACRKAGVPYVIAPRGMLEPWSLRQKWLKKRIARLAYQDRDLRCAAALHATAESEAEQFRRLGFANRIIVSPNGVNVPGVFERQQTPNERKRALFVSRMHPKKGVMELVDAWHRWESGCRSPSGMGWCCELVYTVSGGLEKEYEAKVRSRVAELGLEDRFVFTGALNDVEKWDAYARADLFVLPTYSENFGIVVAEALWAGVPVITTRGTPWQELETERCGWWIDAGEKPLAAALTRATALSDGERREMGVRGRSLVEKKYTWDAVCGEMVRGYRGILERQCAQDASVV